MIIPLPNGAQEPSGAPSLSAAGVARVQDNTGDVLQAAADGLQGLGSAVSAVETMYDEAKAKEAAALLGDGIETQMLNPDSGYLHTLGQDAIGGRRKAAFGAIREQWASLRNGLTTERQKQNFDTQAKRMIADVTFRADVHEARQTRIFNVATAAAREERERRDSLAFVGTEEFEVRLGAIQEEVDRQTELAGFSPESDVGKMARLKSSTKTHALATKALIDVGRASVAQAYLARYGDQIDPAERSTMESLVRRATVNEQAFALSQAIAATGKPINEQIAMVDRRVGKEAPVEVLGSVVATLPPISVEVRDEAVSRLEHAERVRQQGRAEDARAAMVEAESWLVGNPTESPKAMPAALWERLRAHGALDQMLAFGENRRHVTDPDARIESRTVPDAELRTMTSAQVWARWRGRLSNRDFDYVEARHAELQGAATPKHRSIRTIGDMVERTSRELGYLPPPGEKAEAAQIQAHEGWLDRFDGRLLAWQEANGKTATDADLRQLLDLEVADKVRVDNELGLTSGLFFLGSGWLQGPRSTEMRLGDVPEGKIGDAYVLVGAERVRTRDIRQDVVDVLAEDLRLSGKPATFANIAARWVQMGKPKTAGKQGR